MAKAKLTPKTCYMAGLLSKNVRQNNRIGISTGMKELEQVFVEIAVKELGVDPTRITVEENEGHTTVYFFHSRIYKRLLDIIDREVYIFKVPNEFSSNFFGGMFDAAGHIGKEGVKINGLSRNDELALQNLEIHTRNGLVVNPSRLFKLIDGYSIVFGHVKPRDEDHAT